MMRKGRYLFFILIMAFIACSCGKDAPAAQQDPQNPQNPPPSDTTVKGPSSSVLSGPANNTVCLDGSAIDDSSSTVTFQWQASANTESYTLVVTGITNGKQYTINTTGLSAGLALRRNQSYKWNVTSITSKTTKTAKSDTWQFYLAGDPVSSHAPFPATAIYPQDNQVVSTNGAASMIILLTWKGVDIDGDIASYGVYYDQVDASKKIVDAQTDTVIGRAVVPGNTYYWRIVTTDKAGNSSDSGAFMFTVTN